MKKEKIGEGVYSFGDYTIRKNFFKEYGYPRTGWIVDSPDGELGPTWTLKDAIDWIKEILK